MSKPASSITATTEGLSSPGSRPALWAANSSPQILFKNASAIWLRALLWIQTKRTFFFMVVSSGPRFGFGGATALRLHAPATGDGQHCAQGRGQQIDPQVLEVQGDKGRGQRASRV